AVKSTEGGRGGVFRQAVGSQRWDALSEGLADGAEVHAVTVHPEETDAVFIGTTKGAYRSTDRGDHWKPLALPDRSADVWSITIHPTDRRTIYAGFGPTGVYRSDDGGDHWKKLPDPGLPDRVHMTFPCRVMRLDIDPARPDDVYACIEANGAMRSRDRGESWEDCTPGLLPFAEQEKYKSRIVSQTEIEGMLDGHALACSAAAPGTVFLANRMGLFRSEDGGGHWQDVDVGRFSPMTYGRDLRVSPHDPKILYAALSPAFRSADGAIYKSEDVGRTWKRFDHGVKAAATMMGVTTDPRDAAQVYGVSKAGQVFGTQDGGVSWVERRLPEGVGDCYAIACG
ncbi:MAG TPA: hypothetical protein VGP42_03030, partial [Stellaceae bacterium]|nr:hypothetical protein [Stellaceae bacterium]